MTDNEQEQVVKMLVVTAEVMGTEIKPAAAMLMAEDLSGYDFRAVMTALTRCRREISGRLTLKAVMDILSPAGGWLTANEAWATALPATDERVTVVWTRESAKAWQVALPLIEQGDKVGARMAFISAYDRHVADARSNGRPPEQQVSIGWDVHNRAPAIEKAQQQGLLPPPVAEELPALPSPTDPGVIERSEKLQAGLRQLALSMQEAGKQRHIEEQQRRDERLRQVNEKFDRQREAVLAQIAEQEKNQ